MFFWVSKVAWFFVTPSNLIALLLVVGTVALFTRWRRLARGLLVLAALAYVGIGYVPVGKALLRPLEDRFARPGDDMPAPDGIIVLGGGMEESFLSDRNALVLATGGSRMTDTVMLARRYPQARIVFTGGSANLLQGASVTESDAARALFLGLGLPAERMSFEDRSRNTYENAVFTRDLVQPKAGERWLLVTSAFHMPRAMGLFRRAGFNVVAWPADYITHGTPSDYLRPNDSAASGFDILEIGIREWIGLAAYRFSGRIDTLFPGP
jgi:uncharacterized SAM-binding protein YcdF (DUF218 family)